MVTQEDPCRAGKLWYSVDAQDVSEGSVRDSKAIRSGVFAIALVLQWILFSARISVRWKDGAIKEGFP